MGNRTMVSAATLLTSLIGYWYAREIGKDAVPYVMIGGFIGSLIGETLSRQMENEKQ